ncbi:hypothetical protein TEA_007440 [Camellia sinensis var. sinensis]|uniref:Snakin-2 n=1 Tax=Camellia sinensis var. sinensis TaxID=542762 RepID=A0A4S4D1J2_CAMSN|nr:hypothetical protein TEA_007440 [Camellia sinensis var. sinensis]
MLSSLRGWARLELGSMANTYSEVGQLLEFSPMYERHSKVDTMKLGPTCKACSEVSSDAEIEEHQTQVSSSSSPPPQLKEEGRLNRGVFGDADCGGLCKGRCSAHSRPNVCNRACGTCCVRCKCVPPGTSGNREMCGSCYTDMTTHGNKTKCP